MYVTILCNTIEIKICSSQTNCKIETLKYVLGFHENVFFINFKNFHERI